MQQSRPANAIVWILAAFIAIGILHVFSRPFADLHRVKEEVRPLVEESQRYQQANRTVQSRITELNTPEGKIVEAHRQGWIFPGERRAVIQEPPVPKPLIAPAEKNKTLPLFTQMREWMLRKVQG